MTTASLERQALETIVKSIDHRLSELEPGKHRGDLWLLRQTAYSGLGQTDELEAAMSAAMSAYRVES